MIMKLVIEKRARMKGKRATKKSGLRNIDRGFWPGMNSQIFVRSCAALPASERDRMA